MSGVRGPSWRRAETVDLLAIWGEKKVQSALRESHRNKDIFDDVAKQMVERGHNRTGEECRAKSKSMRLAYKRVLAHNNKSGNNRVTCPFFEELDCILKGDPSVKTRRISQTTTRIQTDTTNPVFPAEGTLELFTMDPEDLGDLQMIFNQSGSSRSNSQDGESTTRPDEEGVDMQDNDDTLIEDMDVAGENAVTNDEEQIPEGLNKRNPNEIPPDAAIADLSPSSRLALKTARRKWVSAIHRVGDMMLRQSARDHRAMMEATRSENDRFLEEMRVAREQEQRGTDTMCSLFKEAIGALRDMPWAMLQCQSLRVGPVMVNQEIDANYHEWPSTSHVRHAGTATARVHSDRAFGIDRAFLCEERESGWVDYQVGRRHTPPQSIPCSVNEAVGVEDRYVECDKDYPLATSVITTERPAQSGDSVFRRVASQKAQETLASTRSKRVVKPKKPFSPNE